MERDWEELHRLAKKRSTRNIEAKIENIPKKKKSKSHKAPQSSTQEHPPAAVTPSPKKAPLRRAGQRRASLHLSSQNILPEVM